MHRKIPVAWSNTLCAIGKQLTGVWHRAGPQKWSHMDGYDRAAKALLSLPFPEGHFQRIELFQSNLFGPGEAQAQHKAVAYWMPQ